MSDAFDKRRLRTILDHCADGIALTSETGVLEYVSPAITHILGFAPEEVVGRSSAFLTHPDDVDRLKPVYESLVEQPGRSHAFLGRSRCKNGEWKWMSSVVTNLLHDPDVRAIVTNFRDATDQVTALEAVRASEASFRALIEGLPAPVLVHRDSRIVYVNPALRALLGYDDPGALIGAPALSIVPERYREALTNRARRLVNEPSETHAPSIEVEWLKRDGTIVPVLGEARKLDFDGSPAIVVLAVDLTERRELLARLSVADRMASIGTLAAGVAHEINNPLTYVLTNLTMLADELPELLRSIDPSRVVPPAINQLLDDAREGASRVRSVVRDLLTLSRSNETSQGPVNVAEVLESCLKIAGNELKHRARVIRHYEDVAPVAADSSRLGQVLLNLIVNAAQAMPDGHAEENELRITLEPGDEGHVVVTLADTGCGIPRENLTRVFEPFFTTKPVGLGTGLGLAICHGIVRQLGGEISVTSEPGRGTTFRVSLPAAPSPRVPTNGSSDAVPSSRRGRVLVVDDEAAIGTALRLLLSPEHEVVTTTRAREALEGIAAGARYDAILCDLMMPEMSGMDLYDEIARVAPALAPRIVFLTGGAFSASAQAFLRRVSNVRLDKPFEPAALRRVLHGVMERASAA